MGLKFKEINEDQFMTSRSEIKSTAVYFLFKNSKLFLQRKFSAFDLLKVVKKTNFLQ
jgi:hypothetical protein